MSEEPQNIEEMLERDAMSHLARLEDELANLNTQLRTLESELYLAQAELAEIKELSDF